MRTIFYCSLICLSAIVIVLSATAPNVLGNENDFLRGFVTHELLSILGVIVAITLASSANLHLKFNEIEEKYGQPGGLADTRRRVHQGAYWLISLFLVSVLIVVLKPNFVGSPWAESLINGSCIVILVWSVLIMVAITRLIFSIKPDTK